MSRRLGSKVGIQTSSELPTTQKGMASSVMHWRIPGLPGPFTSALNWHQKNGQSWGTHRCIPVFWECLTNWKTSSIIAGLTICTCLPALLKQPGLMTTKYKYQDQQERVAVGFHNVSSRKRSRAQKTSELYVEQ